MHFRIAFELRKACARNFGKSFFEEITEIAYIVRILNQFKLCVLTWKILNTPIKLVAIFVSYYVVFILGRDTKIDLKKYSANSRKLSKSQNENNRSRSSEHLTSSQGICIIYREAISIYLCDGEVNVLFNGENVMYTYLRYLAYNG